MNCLNSKLCQIDFTAEAFPEDFFDLLNKLFSLQLLAKADLRRFSTK